MKFADVIKVSHQLTFWEIFRLNHKLLETSFHSLVRGKKKKKARERYSSWPAESSPPGCELIMGATGRKLWMPPGAGRGLQKIARREWEPQPCNH